MNKKNTDVSKEVRSQQEQTKKPEIQLSVSRDGMEAAVRVKITERDQTVSFEEVMEFLKENGIVYGILESMIRDFCENRKFFIDCLCAKGLPPEDQDDGKIEYLFNREPNHIPSEREDGTVDYRNLGLVQNVKKGDVLCRVIPPEPGKDGIDVYGKPVPYRRGKLPHLPAGKNTVISEDGMTLTAGVDGCIEYKNATVNVSEVFIVRGDVDSSSGNIDFLGTVIVQGDVLEGFSVKAGGDITVRGMVEGALLEAGGNIVIACGMNGMSHGKLIAGGSVTSQYIENATVECEGDVRADVIFNSIVKAGNSVLVRGRKGLLAGGKCQAGRSVTATVIGSGGAHTEVLIVSKLLDGLLAGKEGEKPDSVKEKLQKEQKNLEILNSQINTILSVMKKNPHSLKAKTLLRNARAQKELAESNIKYLQAKVAAMGKADQQGLSNLDFKISALRTIYAGTKLTIGGFMETLSTDYDSTKFYANHERIISAPIQPIDRI
jgi:uncharacterized protein